MSVRRSLGAIVFDDVSKIPNPIPKFAPLVRGSRSGPCGAGATSQAVKAVLGQGVGLVGDRPDIPDKSALKYDS